MTTFWKGGTMNKGTFFNASPSGFDFFFFNNEHTLYFISKRLIRGGLYGDVTGPPQKQCLRKACCGKALLGPKLFPITGQEAYLSSFQV